MKYKLKVYNIWESGQRKDSQGTPHQEDCTYPLPDKLKDTDRTFILCDGMGGHDAGEVASATVCQAMGNYIFHDGHDAEGVFTEEDLNNAIAAAFAALDEKDNGSEKKMGTTMTFLKLHNEGATVAHIGDSRVYHIRPGKDGSDTQLLYETKDHSLINDLIKIGELTKEEARHSKQKNVITRAMQPNMDRKPKADIYRTSDIKAGDYFYMCSDGMLEQPDMENGESIRNIFSEKIESAERKVEILRDVTEDNRDNHTALIIHIEDVENHTAELIKESNLVVHSKRIAVVEGDEAGAETDSSQISNEIMGHKGIKSEPSEENTRSETPLKEEKAEENNRNEDTNSRPFFQVNKKKDLETKVIFSPKIKAKRSKQIVRFIIAAITVAVFAIGMKYVFSCSSQHDRDKKEFQLKDNPNKEQKPAKEKKTKQPEQNEPQSQPVEQSEGVALDAANSGAAQIVTGEGTRPTSGSSSSTGITNVSLPSQSTEGVVNSDEQTILNNIQPK